MISISMAQGGHPHNRQGFCARQSPFPASAVDAEWGKLDKVSFWVFVGASELKADDNRNGFYGVP